LPVVLSYVRDRLFNDMRYFLQNKKLVALGWKQKFSWKEGLAATFKW
jgi:UDP-glucose 4,6-dehydratase